jgi:parvulin-like peptidyl-prolyl isomerase
VRDAALALAPGEVAGPLDVGGIPTFVLLLERRAGTTPSFESVRPVIAEEWRRRQAEAALEHYLSELRQQAKIEYASDAPAAAAGS